MQCSDHWKWSLKSSISGGTTKSHPPISEHLSRKANDFWLKCLHKLIHPKLPCLIISLQEPYTFVFLWNEV
ncbi:hypothetical protein ACP275_02G109900 [Erythranthe tilingii]